MNFVWTVPMLIFIWAPQITRKAAYGLILDLLTISYQPCVPYSRGSGKSIHLRPHIPSITNQSKCLHLAFQEVGSQYGKGRLVGQQRKPRQHLKVVPTTDTLPSKQQSPHLTNAASRSGSEPNLPLWEPNRTQRLRRMEPSVRPGNDYCWLGVPKTPYWGNEEFLF